MVEINKNNSFVIVISDFYFIDSANNLKEELIKKTGIKQFQIKKIKQKSGNIKPSFQKLGLDWATLFLFPLV